MTRALVVVLVLTASGQSRAACWETGPILRVDASVTSAPLPTSSTSYPLHYRVLSQAEQTHRAELLHQRYPEASFGVYGLGEVHMFQVERAPCDDKKLPAFIAQLATELPEVPFLATDYGASKDSSGVRFEMTASTWSLIANALPTTQLDDEALTKKWSRSRIQYIELISSDPNMNHDPCRDREPNLPCDRPGPRPGSTIRRKLRGDRPFAATWVARYERTISVESDGKIAVVRRIAYPDLQLDAFALEILGSNSDEGSLQKELVITGTDKRDAITGDALPRMH